MDWTGCRILAFDTETTGLNPFDGDRIIEFAAVLLQVDAELQVTGVEYHDFLVNPEMPIPRGSTQVTGITDDHVADKPTFDKRAEQVRELLDDAIIIAHNLPFDVAFLRTELARAGKHWPKTRAEIDTLVLSQRKLDHLKAYKLEVVARDLGVRLEGAHRATNDAEACGRVFVEMCRRLHAPREVEEMVVWADALGPPPETGYFAVADRGLPEFTSGPFAGELVESRPDYLHWMTLAQERVEGAWRARFPDDVREWGRRWLRVKASGNAPSNPRGTTSGDWGIDPPAWRAATGARG